MAGLFFAPEAWRKILLSLLCLQACLWDRKSSLFLSAYWLLEEQDVSIRTTPYSDEQITMGKWRNQAVSAQWREVDLEI